MGDTDQTMAAQAMMVALAGANEVTYAEFCDEARRFGVCPSAWMRALEDAPATLLAIDP